MYQTNITKKQKRLKKTSVLYLQIYFPLIYHFSDKTDLKKKCWEDGEGTDFSLLQQGYAPKLNERFVKYGSPGLTDLSLEINNY